MSPVYPKYLISEKNIQGCHFYHQKVQHKKIWGKFKDPWVTAAPVSQKFALKFKFKFKFKFKLILIFRVALVE